MVKNMNGLKKIKVFYFEQGDHQGVDESRRNWDLIMARTEDDAEKLFKIMNHRRLSDNEIFFGLVEEAMP